jgi:predicted amidohydrolase
MSISRTIENQLLHVVCTRVGKDIHSTYLGGSFIVDGWGRVLVEAGKEEMVLLGEIDLDEAKEIKQKGSIVEDLRTNLY